MSLFAKKTIEPDNRVFVDQQEFRGIRGKLTQRTWKLSYVTNPGRFVEMMAMVNGKMAVVGAWDTVSHEALLSKQHSTFLSNPA